MNLAPQLLQPLFNRCIVTCGIVRHSLTFGHGCRRWRSRCRTFRTGVESLFNALGSDEGGGDYVGVKSLEPGWPSMAWRGCSFCTFCGCLDHRLLRSLFHIVTSYLQHGTADTGGPQILMVAFDLLIHAGHARRVSQHACGLWLTPGLLLLLFLLYLFRTFSLFLPRTFPRFPFSLVRLHNNTTWLVLVTVVVGFIGSNLGRLWPHGF